MKDDLISRQAAIDVADAVWSVTGDKNVAKVWDQIKDLPSAQPDCSFEIQDILDYLDTVLHPIISPEHWNVYSELHDMISTLPSAQSEHTCVNCGRTVNNGGWYADGRTRCPIEEHYALPKDGFCYLWEKRNVTDDDYPERRTDERFNQQTGGS